jgi:N-acetylmuramoyl-L-alanine amidase
VRPALLRRYSLLTLIVIPLALAAAVFGAPAPASAPQPLTDDRRPTADGRLPTATASPTPTPTPTALPTATPTFTPVPTPPPLPTAAPSGRQIRVGIQAGHWIGGELPAELTHLQLSVGASAGGYNEAMINLDIARRVAALLESTGIAVDLLPAVVPPSYAADAFIALHADGARQASARGFKIGTAWAASRASQQLLDTLIAEYGRATHLPRHGAVTADMRGYYAFNYRRYEHTIARTTPAVIVEMGFLTNPDDRALLTGHPDLLAAGLANGIIRYLNQRDPQDQAALQPPDFGVWHGAAAAGLDVRAGPADDAQILLHIEAEQPAIPFEESDGWFRVVVAGAWDVVGWVRKDALVRIAGT